MDGWAVACRLEGRGRGEAEEGMTESREGFSSMLVYSPLVRIPAAASAETSTDY